MKKQRSRRRLSDQNDFFWSFTLRNSSKNRRDDLQLSLKSEAELRERNQGEEAAIMISGVKDLRGRNYVQVH